MRGWLTPSPELPGRWLLAAGAVLGVISLATSIGDGDPGGRLPDVAVGAVYLAAGAGTVRRQRVIGTLLVATGAAWYIDTLTASFEFLHRGPIVHLLLTLPAGRVTGRLRADAVAVGYAMAAFWPFWAERGVAIVAACAIAALSVATAARAEMRAVARRVAGGAAVLFSGVIVASAALLSASDESLRAPIVHAYEIVLATIAVIVANGVRVQRAIVVPDLVVDLGTTRSTALRDAFAAALGDPSLQLGHWTDDLGMPSGAYVTPGGDTLTPPDDRSGRRATFIGEVDDPIALLVHDEALLDDSAILDGITAAMQLQRDHAALAAELRSRVVELADSRRRLVVAGDRAREQLQYRLRSGVERRVVRLEHTARTAAIEGGIGAGHMHLVAEHLAGTRDDLAALARGLHPAELAGGLRAAADVLAARSPLPVTIDDSLGDRRVAPEVEAAAYYVCAEAVTNALKHANASALTITLSADGGCVEVAVVDDGEGGADPRGTGLSGLADRAAAFGGTLSVASSATGTTVRAVLPDLGPTP